MLPAQLEEKLSAALALERAKVERDGRAAFDGPSRTSAAAGRTLLNVHETRAAKVRASGDANALGSLLSDIADEVRIPSVILTEAERRTLAGMVREVGAGVVTDASQLAQDTGRGWMALLKASPLVFVGLLVLAVVLFVRRVPAPGS